MATIPQQKTLCPNPAAAAVAAPPPPPPSPSKNKKRGRPRKTTEAAAAPPPPPSKKRRSSSTTSTSSSPPTKPITAPPLDDGDRCKRNGSSGWRCPFPRIPGKIFCNKHHQLKLINKDRARAAKKQHASPPPTTLVTKLVDAPPPTSYPSPPLPVKLGEVWALSHIAGGAPRAYARIDRIIPTSGRLELTPLVPHPPSQNPPERIPACGTFRTSCRPTTIVKPITSLSHLVASAEEAAAGKSSFEIFPNTGEVWAVYDHPNTGTVYHLAEIVSGFTEDGGVTAARLVPAEEGVGFRRELNGLQRTFMRKDLSWFSHRVPAVRSAEDVAEDSGGGVLWQVFS